MSEQITKQNRDDVYAAQREASEREDLVMFTNACFASTGQTEHYSSRQSGKVSIDFLHGYVLANYRTVYRRVLAAGVNDFNRARIVMKLLAIGAPENPVDRAEEGRLIAVTLRSLPANRVFALFASLRKLKINNRRTRAVVRDYLKRRNDPAFDAVKYRSKLRAVARHAHLELNGETGRFIFLLKDQKHFETPLYDAFLRAHYAKQAIYELPFSIAEGFAARHRIPRVEFLRKIQRQMTHAEKQRVQSAAARLGVATPGVDLSRMPLTKLALYVLSLPDDERRSRALEFHDLLRASARRVLRKRPIQLGKVAIVLDRSRSTCGSREKRLRPLAVAIAIHYLIGQSTDEMRAFWTPSRNEATDTTTNEDHVFLFESGGQTDLATPLLLAIEWRPDNIVIISDGFENAPVDACGQIVFAYRERLSRAHPIAFIHANPVFDPDHFSPKPLGNALNTIGLRDAEDLGASMGFAKFASGEASQTQLEEYLGRLTDDLIGGMDE
ncbi:hypothetical protein [Allorhodopirellula heiligendammensis]|uniref:TROVE domain-containing protein n=1 Tax=Allorhodopirellula heiligendammensis TaxID=2714739 RepID=A0A5C6BVM2_9BACT|nr:hypothetical protein [Allorhodopirellula heiligendammensis]TWU15471.1 hypothetical protein Poly21_26670 [Allorhodopirellula heiligendammensis]